MSILSDELADDPLGRDYSGMSNAEAADNIVNLIDRVIPDHTRRTFRDLLRQEGMAVAGVIAGKLKAGAASNEGIALAVGACTDYGEGGGLDFADQKTIDGIDVIVTGGVISSDEGDKLKAMGKKTVSREVELRLSRTREGTVAQARAS